MTFNTFRPQFDHKSLKISQKSAENFQLRILFRATPNRSVFGLPFIFTHKKVDSAWPSISDYEAPWKNTCLFDLLYNKGSHARFVDN